MLDFNSTKRTTISDKGYTIHEFRTLITDAEFSASRDWDINFVADVSERFDEYGLQMFWTEKQDEKLQKIAGY